MSEISGQVMEQVEQGGESHLNSKIAIVVAISASLMAIFNIKDNNIVQAMSQAQAHAIDNWSYFQAKSTKQNMAENQLAQLQLQLTLVEKASSPTKEKIHVLIQDNQAKIQKYEIEKNEIKQKAEENQKEYDSLNVHDDQFDLAEALISLGLSIFGITALTKKKPLFYFGMAFSVTGAFFGLAGFFNWTVHPDWLTSLLS